MNLEDQPDLKAALSTFATSESRRFLIDSEDEGDYKVRLHYFFGQVFLVARELDGQERQAIFNNTLPDFARHSGAERAHAAQTAVLSEHFDAAYKKFFTWFMKSMEKLGKRFLDSEAGKDWLEGRDRAK